MASPDKRDCRRLVCERLGFRINNNPLIDQLSFVSEARYRGLALLGPNGAGKTTLLRICHGLLKPGSGSVMWGGIAAHRLLGKSSVLIPQKPCLLRRSAYEQINYVLAARQIARSARHHRITEVLDAMRLSHLRDRLSWSLSAGEQKRLMFACALALRPRILLLDEPSSELDMQSTKIVEQAIRQLQSSGSKLIITSHNPAQVRRLCDEVVFIDRGRLLCHAECGEFFKRTTRQKGVICDFIEAYAFS